MKVYCQGNNSNNWEICSNPVCLQHEISGSLTEGKCDFMAMKIQVWRGQRADRQLLRAGELWGREPGTGESLWRNKQREIRVYVSNIGLKSRFIFTPASQLVCSSDPRRSCGPFTSERSAQSLFFKFLGLKSGFIFIPATQPVCGTNPRTSQRWLQ